jgi:hypothetical protein
LEIYDPATDTWTTKANMSVARLYPQGVVLNDTFYVSGGLIGSPWTGQKTVQKYDPTTDNWELGTNLIHGRVGHTTNVVNGKICAIGGDTQPPVVENVEEYDPQAETWTVIDPTPRAMILHTSSVYDNLLYVFSGSTTNITRVTLTDSVFSYYLSTSSSESQKNQIPDVFVLHQNYPNPFNPSTTIGFTLPKSEFVELKVYNILGKEVSTLVSNKLNSGNHTYQFNGNNLASGIYYYRIQSGEFQDMKKMVLIR